jgi:hypothetical protein
MTGAKRQVGVRFLLAIVLGLPAAALAQDPAPTVPPASGSALPANPMREPDSLSHRPADNVVWGLGSRVRVKATDVAGFADGEWIVGRVDAIDPEAVCLVPKGKVDVLRIPKRAVDSLEVSNGRSRGVPALIGAGIATLGGAAVGLVEMSRCEARGEMLCGLAPIAAVIIAAPIGAVVGAVIGKERWTKAPISTLKLGAAPLPGGFRIGGSVTF